MARDQSYPAAANASSPASSRSDVSPSIKTTNGAVIKSRAIFAQMKSRGVCVIKPGDVQSVTRDAKTKDRFVFVDESSQFPSGAKRATDSVCS